MVYEPTIIGDHEDRHRNDAAGTAWRDPDAASAGERIVIERDHMPMALLVPYEDASRLEPDEQERLARNLAAIDRLEALGERLAREHAWPADAPDAVTAIREDRSRDDP